MQSRVVFVLLVVQLALAFSPGNPQPWMPKKPVMSPNFKLVMNILCSSSKLDQVKADACYGCFARVAGNIQNNQSFEEIGKCADTYLQETEFKDCGDILTKAEYSEDDMNSTVFCDFENCVRKFDKEELVQQCSDEVAKIEGLSKVKIYLSTTACILSKIRCREINQATDMYYNGERNYALLVSDDDALKVLQLPYGSAMGITCNSGPPYGAIQSLKQASWPSATC